MTTHSSMLASEIPWTEEPVRQQSMGSQRDMPEQLSTCACTHTHTHTHTDTHTHRHTYTHENGFNNLAALLR